MTAIRVTLGSQVRGEASVSKDLLDLLGYLVK